MRSVVGSLAHALAAAQLSPHAYSLVASLRCGVSCRRRLTSFRLTMAEACTVRTAATTASSSAPSERVGSSVSALASRRSSRSISWTSHSRGGGGDSSVPGGSGEGDGGGGRGGGRGGGGGLGNIGGGGGGDQSDTAPLYSHWFSSSLHSMPNVLYWHGWLQSSWLAQ